MKNDEERWVHPFKLSYYWLTEHCTSVLYGLLLVCINRVDNIPIACRIRWFPECVARCKAVYPGRAKPFTLTRGGVRYMEYSSACDVMARVGRH